MHIHPIIRTSYRSRHLPPRPLIDVSLTPAELPLLSRAIEGEADAANALSWRAAALRETGR